MEQLIPGIEQNFWTKCLEVAYLKGVEEDPDARFVVTDVRFQNEVDLINSLGGTVIRLTRPELPSEDTHPSENTDSVKDCYYTLVNDSSITELHNRLEGILRIEALFTPLRNLN